MQQERDEEQDRRGHCQAHDKAVAPLRIAGMKFGVKRKYNQEGDEKPAVMQPNFDSKDSSELDLRSQPRYLLRSARREHVPLRNRHRTPGHREPAEYTAVRPFLERVSRDHGGPSPDNSSIESVIRFTSEQWSLSRTSADTLR